jgi:hypothetical protein
MLSLYADPSNVQVALHCLQAVDHFMGIQGLEGLCIFASTLACTQDHLARHFSFLITVHTLFSWSRIVLPQFKSSLQTLVS